MLHRRAETETPDSIFKAFKALRRKERSVLLERMLKDKRLREELEDIFDYSLSVERMKQPSRPLKDVLREIDKGYAKKRGLSRRG